MFQVYTCTRRVESGEKAIAIINGMKRYIPYFIALSANSPFFEGENTGLASTRTKIFEGLPNTGIPERLRNYSEFQKFMRTLIKANSIDSIKKFGGIFVLILVLEQ